MSKAVTLPVLAWEIVVNKPAEGCVDPQESDLAGDVFPLSATVPRDTKPCRPSPAGLLFGRTFRGRLNVSDFDYMAKAILQICDENHELRERVRRLEERLGL